MLLHGLTATRRYVIHGSRALERAGFDVCAYDARGHGASDPPADGSYEYEALAADLDAIGEAVAGNETLRLAGHSMGAHTLARYALDHPGRVAALAFLGPVTVGGTPPPEEIEGWDELAEGLEAGGVGGFIETYAKRPWPAEWRDTVIRITRERLEQHRDLGAIAAALRAVPRSVPFSSLSELGGLTCPVLVVASHDEADPGHPYAVAEQWADAIPGAKLISEEPGASPLTWQGGRLARALAEFFLL